MKESTYSELIKYWEKVNDKDKNMLLQNYENSNAKQLKREELEVVYTNPNPKQGNCSAGCFKNAEKRIYIFKIPEIEENPFFATDTTFHEGYHAVCKNRIYSDSTIKTYDANLTKKQLYEMFFLDKYINSKYYVKGFYNEENLVRNETIVNDAKEFIVHMENEQEVEKYSPQYLYVLYDYFAYKGMLKRVIKNNDYIIWNDELKVFLNNQKKNYDDKKYEHFIPAKLVNRLQYDKELKNTVDDHIKTMDYYFNKMLKNYRNTKLLDSYTDKISKRINYDCFKTN